MIQLGPVGDTLWYSLGNNAVIIHTYRAEVGDDVDDWLISLHEVPEFLSNVNNDRGINGKSWLDIISTGLKLRINT